jgi:hypothetical protein
MESINEPFIFDIGRTLQSDIDNKEEIKAVSLPEVEGGVVVLLRVYPTKRFTYPAYAKGVRTFKKKDKMLLVSSNIEIESLIGLNQIEIYNVFLNRIIESLSILEEKKIKGADVGYLSSMLETFLQ